ncbi:MAG: hypothetical protein ABFS32_23385 [Bacteroidota bacterium]
MKTILKSIIILVLFALTSNNLHAQDKISKVVTKEFHVSGVCSMCEERIENAALIKGVKQAEWDKTTKMLKVIYNSYKTDELQIHKAVAEHGHDTKKEKADDEVYKKLPFCCHYRDGAKDH